MLHNRLSDKIKPSRLNILGRGKTPTGIGTPVHPTITVTLDPATNQLNLKCDAELMTAIHMLHNAQSELLRRSGDVQRQSEVQIAGVIDTLKAEIAALKGEMVSGELRHDLPS